MSVVAAEAIFLVRRPVARWAWVAFGAGALAAAVVAVMVWSAAGGDDAGSHGAAEEIVARTNAERARVGLPALEIDAALTRASGERARELADGAPFSHTGADGTTLDARVEAAGYEGWVVVAENLAMGAGAPPAEAVVAGWLRSAGHRQNLLSARAAEIGVSCASSDGDGERRYWCVAVFGTRWAHAAAIKRQ